MGKVGKTSVHTFSNFFLKMVTEGTTEGNPHRKAHPLLWWWLILWSTYCAYSLLKDVRQACRAVRMLYVYVRVHVYIDDFI